MNYSTKKMRLLNQPKYFTSTPVFTWWTLELREKDVMVCGKNQPVRRIGTD